MDDLNLVVGCQRDWSLTNQESGGKDKQKTRTRKMLLSFGKQHGNEEAWICDLSTPQQARPVVQFVGVNKNKIGLPVNSVIFYICNRILPSMMYTALIDNPS